MIDKYITKNGKKLRYGFTTGSCGTAAAKAATTMLFTRKEMNKINIDTPKGWNLEIFINDIDIKEDSVSCSVIKDSGDDPDITKGMKIHAKAEKLRIAGIEITGGEGVGKVTKKGLSTPVGQYAINPVPLEMIKKEVSMVLPKGEGVRITIYAPEGKERARKTFNPKLGIVGGISIIGTTGIVEPMSDDALMDSIAIELSILKEQGIKKVVFTPGNYGKNFIVDNGFSTDRLVKVSNYIGFMLDKAVEYEFEEVLLIGHIGKLIKVAGGIFNTHSRIADARMEILAANCALMGCDRELIAKIMDSITTEEAIEYILENKYEKVFNNIADKITKRCEERTYNQIKIGTIIFSTKRGKLGSCPYSNILMEEFCNE